MYISHVMVQTTAPPLHIAMQGGGTVRLYHKQKESYVVAKGSFAGVYANIKEIRRVHEMHPDFRISITQGAIDRGLEAATSEPGSNGVALQRRVEEDATRNSVQVQVDVEVDRPVHGSTYFPEQWSREPQAGNASPFSLTPLHARVSSLPQEDAPGCSMLAKKLDFKNSFQSKGVVDEDGKSL